MRAKGERGQGGKEARESAKQVWAFQMLLLLSLASILLLSLAQPVQAQVRLVELINADQVTVESDSVQGVVRRLNGNVVLRQDTTMLYADRAVQVEARGEVELEGSVRIESGDVTLWAPRVTYDSNAKEASAEGDVRIEDEETVLLSPSARYLTRTEQAVFEEGGRLLHDGAELTAPRGTYDAQRNMATFADGVQLHDSTAVLTSERGTYDTEAERANFAGVVRLRQRGVRLYADSLVHFRELEQSEAFGQVVVERLGDADEEADGGETPDSTRRTLLFGALALHDAQARTSQVEGTAESDPLLVQLRMDSTGVTDTTLVRARRFDALQRDSLGGTLTRIVGVGDIQLVRPSMAARADSVVFVRLESSDSTAAVVDRLTLFGEARPSIWFDEAQITGDTLIAYARAESLDSLDVLGNAFVAQLDTTLGRVRQMRGRQMQARFARDSLRALAIWPNAEAIYFRATDDGLLDGADRLSADSLTFLFRDDELRELRGTSGIEGVAYGPQIIPDPFQLQGYIYTPERRPLRAMLLPPDGWEAEWFTTTPAVAEDNVVAPVPPDTVQPRKASSDEASDL